MKRPMIGLLVATLATEAFAYYNSGQGRWLNRVNPIPGVWPPKNDGSYDYDGLAKNLSDTWCSILKSLEKCCKQKSKITNGGSDSPSDPYYGGGGGEESDAGCNCDKCLLNIQFTNKKSTQNPSPWDDFTYNVYLIKKFASNLTGLRQGCSDLDADIRMKFWGDGLPRKLSPPSQFYPCKK